MSDVNKNIGICGTNCEDCDLFKNSKCSGCINTNSCPFGKKCFIAKYIEIGGKESFEEIKKELINEINSLTIDGMSKIDDLIPLNGAFVNLEYRLPNGINVRFLNEDEIYLGTQIECEFNDGELNRYFGIVANMNFILVSEYDEDGNNTELILYKKR